MSNELSIRQIEKFDGSNYHAWKYQIMQSFITLDVEDIVYGEEKKPEGQDLEKLKKWRQSNSTAILTMTTSMTLTIVNMVRGCETANEMWEKLESLYEGRTRADKVAILDKFHAARMEPDENVATYITRLENFSHQLKEAGEKISQDVLITKILRGLPESYRLLKIVWDSVDPQRQTLSHLRERLVKEEMNLLKEDNMASALYSTHNKGKFQKRDKNSNFNVKVCYNCDKKGHIAKECRNKNKEFRSKANESKQNEVNRKGSFQSNKQNNAKGESRDNKNQNKNPCFALMADCDVDKFENSDDCASDVSYTSDEGWIADDINDVWLIDSGASRHISFRREWFCSYRPITGQYVNTGDNRRCQIAGVGTILMRRFVNN